MLLTKEGEIYIYNIQEEVKLMSKQGRLRRDVVVLSGVAVVAVLRGTAAPFL